MVAQRRDFSEFDILLIKRGEKPRKNFIQIYGNNENNISDPICPAWKNQRGEVYYGKCAEGDVAVTRNNVNPALFIVEDFELKSDNSLDKFTQERITKAMKPYIRRNYSSYSNA